jgi:hypothetical protein
VASPQVFFICTQFEESFLPFNAFVFILIFGPNLLNFFDFVLQQDRNNNQAMINWQFINEKARIILKKRYLTISNGHDAGIFNRMVNAI